MIYEVGRSVDVLDTLTDVIEDACASNGNTSPRFGRGWVGVGSFGARCALLLPGIECESLVLGLLIPSTLTHFVSLTQTLTRANQS